MINLLENINKKYIIGVDEVGTGPICGPTYVCAFKAAKEWEIEGIRDSKQLTAKRREAFSSQLHKMRDDGIVNFKILSASSQEIDQEGILNTVHRLFHEALQQVGFEDSAIVIDGKKFKESRYEYINLIGGDDIIKQISAASVLAKVARDAEMVMLDKQYPEYNWKNNKGYPTVQHKAALNTYGISPLHRRSYEPVKSMIKN